MSDRFELRGLVWPTLMLLVMAGCGGGDGGGGGDAGGGAAMEDPVDAATAGNIAGSIVFEGDAPSMAVIDMSQESVCADKHSSTPMIQEVVVNSNGTLANVFVYVKEGLESLQFPTPGPVLLDQNGCVYLPHVLGVMVGQDITIRNSDGLLHNINASPTVNRGFNSSQPVSMESTRSFGSAEIMVPLRCDVHGWMTAYVGVVDHPKHSVSNGSGAFSLSTLPPGEYVIEAWHERYGTQTQNVTVTTGETTEVTFTFSAS
ncbi:MAG: carboxypeptidase regulatory-like domain-containing protein [Gemmatimonadetes bacterium]|nr:carboxypeptidase regulatory-like domain-containing protein [Gemmatimonadota bacterium]